MRYIVFDVETPNRFNDRMCSIGISVLENGRITDTFYSLVNPETFFDSFNVKLTGIDNEKVMEAPNFPMLWQQIEPLFNSGMLVAHNAIFDMTVLKKCLHYYNISWKPYVYYICTVQIGRYLLPNNSHKLDAMCAYYDIKLDHHKADSDSLACAHILLKYLEDDFNINKFIRTCKF